MARIRTGTCSWTDPTLLSSGRFYPESANSPEARLRYYSAQFDLVEVDSSYYAMPAERTSRLWVERVPDDFAFDIKAFRLFTQHPTTIDSLPGDIRLELSPRLHDKGRLYYRDLPGDLAGELWDRFASALLPLDSAGKLGLVLFQFPPWFTPGTPQLDYILTSRERLPQYRLAVEFRNNLWLSEKNRDGVFGFLRQHDLPFVCVDEPQGFRSSVPPVAEATADIGVVRFHGRNSDTWEKKGITVVERFNYLYSEEELKPWAEKIRQMAGATKEMHVLFNNCHQDKAVVNAGQMRLMLRPPGGAFRGEGKRAME